jgi:hypothetical protein
MTSPAETISTTIQLVLCAVLLVVAVQAYRVRHTIGFLLLLLSCIAHMLVRFAWFAYDLLIASFSLHVTQSSVPPLADWNLWSARFLHIVFLGFMIFAVTALRRERGGSAT